MNATDERLKGPIPSIHGILNDINKQDTFFLDCKHKHMMKCESPPDKFGVLYRMFTYRIPWFH